MRFVRRLRGMLVQLNLPFVSAYKLHRCYLIPVCSHGYLYMSLRNVSYVHRTFAICSISCLYSWLYFLFFIGNFTHLELHILGMHKSNILLKGSDRFTMISTEISPDFVWRVQQDVQELLRCLLDKLDEASVAPRSSEEPSSTEDGVAKEVFGGLLKSQVCLLIFSYNTLIIMLH
jgi:hypothetical protein